MDKKELINFLKNSLKITISTKELYNGRTEIVVDLALEVDDEEIMIDKDCIVID